MYNKSAMPDALQKKKDSLARFIKKGPRAKCEKTIRKDKRGRKDDRRQKKGRLGKFV